MFLLSMLSVNNVMAINIYSAYSINMMVLTKIPDLVKFAINIFVDNEKNRCFNL